MSRIKALSFEELTPELQGIMQAGESIMGFMPNDGLIMARKPAMLKAMLEMVQAIYQQGEVSLELKKLVALMTSNVTGCLYCQTHTSFGALNAGVSADKVEAIWEYSTSNHFSDAERAALDLARDAAQLPSAVTNEQFENLRQYFNDEQIVELVGVVSLFGFLNRWNSTMDTEIEAEPKEGTAALTRI